MRTKTVALFPALIILSLTAHAAPMTYPCYRTDKAPVLDGDVVADPAWKDIPAVTGFSKLGDGYTLAKQTVVRACWDAQALYVGVVCEEPDAAKLKAKMTDGGPFWSEDSIELFFQPGLDKNVLQFGVTAFGAKGAAEGFPDFTKYQAAAHRGTDSYSLEVRIPFDVLHATPRQGSKWRGNFCRNIFTTDSGGDKFTCWAPLQTRFLEPEHFATIVFEGPAPSATRAAEISEKLNSAYRANLTGRLRTAAAQGKEYVRTLKEASHDKRFGAKATDLLAQWRQVGKLSRAAAKTPILELRHTIANLDALAKASYDVKYGYLISKVFGDE